MKRLLAIALSLALLAWLLADGRWRELATYFERLDLALLGMALAGLFASYVLRALRVHEEFRHDGPGRFLPCLRIVLIHNAMVNIVPFRGGEAAFPVLLHRTFGTPVSRAVASLFWFRLQDVFVVAALACLVWPGLPPLLRVLGVAGIILCAWWLPRWARSSDTPTTPASGRLRRIADRLRQAFAESTRHARRGWLWTLANWSVKLGIQAWLLASLLAVPLSHGASGVLGAELAAILPIQGVAGFGTYEAGAAAALAPHEVSLERGLQAAFVLHLVVIVTALGAGLLAWLCLPTSALSPQARAEAHE